MKNSRVFYYFEKICGIPHISHNTKELSDFLIQFAKDMKLEYYSDGAGNVLISKQASEGYEEHEGVILQGHIDMVGAKASGSEHDFLTDPIEIIFDKPKKGYISAAGTTLGADNGIAVAYMLAILEDDSLKHPPIEALFTVDEEVGLLGAKAFDASRLKGKYLINLDSEEEGYFLTACAGGVRVDLCLDNEETDFEGLKISLCIDGLNGGHSGSDIHLGRASANILMGRLLAKLDETVDYYISNLHGGDVDNAICPKCTAEIVIDPSDYDNVVLACEKENKEYLLEYRNIDSNIYISVARMSEGTFGVANDFTREKILCMLRLLPYGVTAREADNPELVITSLNPGVLRYSAGHFRLGYAVRSSISGAKKDIVDKIEFLTEYLGGYCEESGDYPAWEYKQESKLREVIESVYSDMFNTRPKFTSIHAGLECGLFFEGNPNLDIISYGPDMYDVHTCNENLCLDSAKRVYDFTIKLLENL